MAAKILVTISIPVFNEEDNIERLLNRLDTLALVEKAYDFEFLFTDNASSDRTFEKLVAAASADSRIRALRFSRNFGFQRSILMNYMNAKGAAAVQIDADLQDPPELISEFLRAWEAGYKVVYGVRRRRPEFFVKRWARMAYYRLVSWLSETELPVDAGDFRLIDRCIIEELSRIKEQTPYLRGLIANLGYSQKGIVYDRSGRISGVSKFHLLQLVELGIDGITSQSTRPLRMITLFGVATSILAMAAAAFYLYVFLTQRTNLPSGFTTLIIVGLVTLGLNSFFVGLIGEYVGRIFNNTRGLPIALIESRIEPLPSQSFELAKSIVVDAAKRGEDPS